MRCSAAAQKVRVHRVHWLRAHHGDGLSENGQIDEVSSTRFIFREARKSTALKCQRAPGFAMELCQVIDALGALMGQLLRELLLPPLSGGWPHLPSSCLHPVPIDDVTLKLTPAWRVQPCCSPQHT
jgi:hypothetical protein